MGWDVQVRRDESKEEQFKEKIGGAAHTLGEQLGISDELAEKLTLAGGIAPEYIIGMSEEDIAEASKSPSRRPPPSSPAPNPSSAAPRTRRLQRLILISTPTLPRTLPETSRMPEKSDSSPEKDKVLDLLGGTKKPRAASASARMPSHPHRTQQAGQSQKRSARPFSEEKNPRSARLRLPSQERAWLDFQNPRARGSRRWSRPRRPQLWPHPAAPEEGGCRQKTKPPRIPN
jgi:hypothetical protein